LVEFEISYNQLSVSTIYYDLLCDPMRLLDFALKSFIGQNMGQRSNRHSYYLNNARRSTKYRITKCINWKFVSWRL